MRNRDFQRGEAAGPLHAPTHAFVSFVKLQALAAAALQPDGKGPLWLRAKG
jgi:hypothetical protein